MTTTLPETIERYFAADHAHDIDGVVACFAENATVHDERHDHMGRAAIRDWKAHAQNAYTYTSTPLTVTTNQNTTMVHARLEGTFPGSPVEVDYRFTLHNDEITHLAID